MKKYFWEEQIVSVEWNVVTFKWGVQETFSPLKLLLVTDEKLSKEELDNKKLQHFQAQIFEAFDLLEMTNEQFYTWLDLIKKKWDDDQQEKLKKLLWVSSFADIKYSTIHR